MPTWRNRTLSASPLVDYGESVTLGQKDWWLVNDGIGNNAGGGSVGSSSANLCSPFRPAARGGVTTPPTSIGDPIGRAWLYDGSGNGYHDIGGNFVSGTAPFTLHWLEYVGSSPSSFPAVFCFFPPGNSQRWLCCRTDNGTYGRLFVGLGNASAAIIFASAPTLASSVGIWRQWILSSAAGLNSATASDWTLTVDGTSYTASAAASGISSQTSQFNYIGWDGADDKWKGRLACVRRWNRVITPTDKLRLFADPWAGLDSGDMVLVPSAAAAAVNHRMLLAF